VKPLSLLALGLLLLGGLSLRAQDNIVMDGEFDTPASSFAPSWSTQASDSGSFFFVDAGAAYFGSTGNFDYISQTLPTTIGTTYEIFYDLATSNTDPGDEYDDEFVANYGGILQATQDGTTILGSPNFIAGGYTFDDTTYTEVNDSYTAYTWDFTADSTSTNLIFGGFNGPQYFFLDHVSVTQVPEPAQWGLPVFLGFISLLAFRKFRPKPPGALAAIR